MEKITKEQRKQWNRLVDDKKIETAEAKGALPFLLIGMLVLAYFMNEYIDGKIAVGIIIFTAVVGRMSQIKVNNKIHQ